MRTETKNLQMRIDELIASDERSASTIHKLISWIDQLSRAIDEQRQENHRVIDRTAEILGGEIDVLRKELKAIAERFTGDEEEPEPAKNVTAFTGSKPLISS